jgi:hypothetical protein
LIFLDTNDPTGPADDGARWNDCSAHAHQRSPDRDLQSNHFPVFASAAKQSSSARHDWDCFVATLLAKTSSCYLQQITLWANPFSPLGKAGSARRGSEAIAVAGFLHRRHAAIAGYRWLTRDAARYRSYFPRVRLIAPN